MPIHTVFLDAGGILVYPNWSRVSETMERHGVLVPAQALSDAEPRAKLAHRLLPALERLDDVASCDLAVLDQHLQGIGGVLSGQLNRLYGLPSHYGFLLKQAGIVSGKRRGPGA